MNASKRGLFCGVALACASSFAPALAQEALKNATAATNSNFQRDRNVSVRQRPHPGYEAIGLREGAFMVWPKLNTTVEYNDNVFAAPSSTQSDTVWHVAPEVDISSNWSRHEFDAWARATLNRYSDFNSENTTDFDVGANGRLDVLRNAQINFGAEFAKATEPRTAPTSLGLPLPSQYDLTTGFVSGAREFNRLRVSGRLDAQNFNYLNRRGNPAQHDRDHTLYIATERADYAVSPDTAWFVQLSQNKRDYRLSGTPAVLAAYPFFRDRDSKGVQVLTGVNFELSALVRGELGVGYMKQDYDNPAFRNISGLGANGQLEWFPTQLTTVTLTGSRTIEDAGLPGASGYLSNNIGAQVDHELLRNVVVSANASYGKDDYRGVDRTDTRTAAGVSATYLFTRALGVTVGYNHFTLDSKGLAGSGKYSINKVGATLTLQY